EAFHRVQRRDPERDKSFHGQPEVFRAEIHPWQDVNTSPAGCGTGAFPCTVCPSSGPPGTCFTGPKKPFISERLFLIHHRSYTSSADATLIPAVVSFSAVLPGFPVFSITTASSSFLLTKAYMYSISMPASFSIPSAAASPPGSSFSPIAVTDVTLVVKPFS